MTTAITATLLEGPYVEGFRRKRTKLSLLLPTVWAAAGHAVDLSLAANGSYTYITDYKFEIAAAAGAGAKFNLIGTVGTGTNAAALLASSIAVVAHHDMANADGGAHDTSVLAAMPNSADPSTWACHLTVWGY